ncbi:MAG: hypothetical protein BZ137_09230 [Methanosphaera sp. rholeuAM130]|nr:MAG: hypothetical protein BZ137_09230 [Methanosphaera sp. rholeuAM130]
MEHLNSIQDNLKTINDDDIHYLDLFDYPEFFYGNVNNIENTDFCKYPKIIQEEMKEYEPIAIREMNNYNSSPTGVRLRFNTDSKRLIFKVELKRKWDYQKLNNLNSSGFDVYCIDGTSYIHQEVFSPGHGYNIFAKEITTPENGNICIYLPSYNSINRFYIGIEKDCKINELNYPKNKQLPIIFYGNSVTQGAAASRSGNSFPNIVSRKLNRDIVNLSCSSCCKGTQNTADLIGSMNCHAIIIDYTQNAYDTNIFRNTHERFYKKIRQYHPDIPIILLTTANFNFWRAYNDFDVIVENTYNNAIFRSENTFLINQKELFNEDEYDYVAVDKSHFTDYGMFKIAERICDIIRE